jgi:hypothetical protein
MNTQEIPKVMSTKVFLFFGVMSENTSDDGCEIARFAEDGQLKEFVIEHNKREAEFLERGVPEEFIEGQITEAELPATVIKTGSPDEIYYGLAVPGTVEEIDMSSLFFQPDELFVDADKRSEFNKLMSALCFDGWDPGWTVAAYSEFIDDPYWDED